MKVVAEKTQSFQMFVSFFIAIIPTLPAPMSISIQLLLLFFCSWLVYCAKDKQDNAVSSNILTKEQSKEIIERLFQQNEPLFFPSPSSTAPKIIDFNDLYSDENNYTAFVHDPNAFQIISNAANMCFANTLSEHKSKNIHADKLLQEAGWTITPIRRTALATRNDLHEYLLKVTISLPGRNNPFASVLRVPFGNAMRRVIESERFDLLTMPREGIVPIVSPKLANQMDEYTAPYGFLVVSKKINIGRDEDVIAIFHKIDVNTQYRAAEQICKLIVMTCFDDPQIGTNIVYEKSTGMFVIIDTEPLYFEMIVRPSANPVFEEDRISDMLSALNMLNRDAIIGHFTENYYLRSKEWMGKNCCLPCTGLTVFYESARHHNLYVLEAVAEKYMQHYGCK